MSTAWGNRLTAISSFCFTFIIPFQSSLFLFPPAISVFHFSSCISKQTLSLTLLTYSPLSLFLSRPTLPVPLQHTLSFAAVHSLSLSLSRPTLSLSLSPLSCPIFTLSCPTLTLSFAPLSPSSLSLAPLSVSSYSHTLLPTSLSISSHSYSLVPLSLSISRPTLTSLSLIPLSSLSYSPYSLSLTPLSFLSFTPFFFLPFHSFPCLTLYFHLTHVTFSLH